MADETQENKDNEGEQEEENNENKQNDPLRKTDMEKRKEASQKLKAYLNSMQYKTPERAPKASDRIEQIAKSSAYDYVFLYEQYGKVLTPKERAARIKRKAKDQQFITTEQLHSLLQKQKQREKMKSEGKKRRERILKNILDKLETKCHEQLMSTLVEKFAVYMATECANYKRPVVITKNILQLTQGLVYNMFLSLGIRHCPSEIDVKLYETVGEVLSNMIFDLIFSTKYCQESPEHISHTSIPEQNCFKTKSKGKMCKPPKFSKQFQKMLKLMHQKVCT